MPHRRSRSRKSKPPARETLIADEVRLLAPGSNAGLRAAVGFPNSYSVAMSNLGFHQVYRLLSGREDLRVERFFHPSPGGEPGTTLEDLSGLGSCRLIALSLSYEADYVRAIAALRAAGIPLRRKDRTARDPFVLLGGVAITANPRPLEPLADAIVLGESERTLPALLDLIVPALHNETSRPRTVESVAGDLRGPGGVYFPGTGEVPSPVRLSPEDLERFPTHSVFLTPHTVFGDTFLVEMSRGCDRACSFCLTGHMLHGCRMRPMESILGQVEGPGGECGKVGLISAEVSSHPDIEEIVERILGWGKQVTVSSMEADRISERLLSLLARSGLETLTLAPEAGSDGLRRRIHKGFTNEQFLATAAMAASAGIRNLKVYYLIGIHEDGEEEVEALVRLTEDVARVVAGGRKPARGGSIRVTLSPIVPKPHTPLGDRPMLPVKELRGRLRRARSGLAAVPGVRVSTPSVREAEMEYRIGTGDASVFEWLCERALSS